MTTEQPFARFIPVPEKDDTVTFVRLDDDFAVPRRFVAEGVRNGHPMALEIEVSNDGAARCIGLRIFSAGSQRITAETLRLPIAGLTKQAVAGCARKFTPLEEGGEPVFRLISTGPSEAAAFYERYVTKGRRPRQGSPLTDENLSEVAQVYRAAVKNGDPPTRAVMGAMHVERSTASRWIRAARDRGLLGPAMRGKGGEAA